MRSGTTASRRSFDGVPPGNTSIDQPPPRIHSRSGCASAYDRTACHVLVAGVEVVQIALQPVHTAADRVDVRVLEPRHQHPSAEVDDLRRRVDLVADVVVGADGHDPSVLDRDGARAGPRRIHRVHGAVHEGQLGRAHRRSIAVRRARRGRGGPRSSSRGSRPASTGPVPGQALRRTRCRGSRSPSRPASRGAPARSPSRDGGSRLFVGSSRSSRFFRPATSCASASFVFSPPESVPASWNARSPGRPNIPSSDRSDWSSAGDAWCMCVEHRHPVVDPLVLLRVVPELHPVAEPERPGVGAASPPRGSGAGSSSRHR